MLWLKWRCVIFPPFPLALRIPPLVQLYSAMCILLTSPIITLPPLKIWLSLIVCNCTVLASAFFKFIDQYFNTRPTGTMFSSRGRRVGVKTPGQSLISFPPPQLDRDGASEDERSSTGVELPVLKLDITVDLELPDIIVARAKSPSPPPPTIFNGQLVS